MLKRYWTSWRAICQIVEIKMQRKTKIIIAIVTIIALCCIIVLVAILIPVIVISSLASNGHNFCVIRWNITHPNPDTHKHTVYKELYSASHIPPYSMLMFDKNIWLFSKAFVSSNNETLQLNCTHTSAVWRFVDDMQLYVSNSSNMVFIDVGVQL